jgi:biotin transport system substrate-specific component
MELLLEKEIITNKIVSFCIVMAAFTAAIVFGAYVRIPLPFTPVPITLQTFFVLLAPVLLSRGQGVLPSLLYVLLGATGLPVFTGLGSGLLYLTGPTGGYIVGFLLASFFIAQALPRIGDSKGRLFILVLIADALLFLCGVLWLKILFPVSFVHLLGIGVLPFIPGEVCKIIAVTVLGHRLRPRVQRVSAL